MPVSTLVSQTFWSESAHAHFQNADDRIRSVCFNTTHRLDHHLMDSADQNSTSRFTTAFHALSTPISSVSDQLLVDATVPLHQEYASTRWVID